jgi:glycosyltransferase involved in cell wall biosynthesis
MIALTATIITFNEEKNIERCLQSLQGVADEIVVVDSHSTDQTKAICERYGVRFIANDFKGHIEQKNVAIDCASNNWILSLDADEALTSELREAILELKKNPSFNGYSFNRLTYYCGHWVKYCGWYPDTKLRLVHKAHARWTGVNPHDRLAMHTNEAIGHLKGDLLHYSYYTREDHLRQIDYFSSIAAKELFQRGKKSSWLLILLKVTAQFFKSFFLKTGFLDGYTGWTISRLSAFATYKKYHNLLKLNRGESL